MNKYTIIESANYRQFVSIFFMVLVCLFTSETLVPYLSDGNAQLLELAEGQEENENKKGKEKEVNDVDEFLHYLKTHRFCEKERFSTQYVHFIETTSTYSDVETPPPEQV